MSDIIRKKSLLFKLAIAGAVILVLGFFLTRSEVNSALVKQGLDFVITKVENKARASGHDLKITYEAIEVAGDFRHRYVIVRNLAMSMKPLDPAPTPPGQPQKSDSLVITTPVLEIYPQAFDLSEVRAAIPQPITIAGGDAPDKSLLTITANTPFALDYHYLRMYDIPRVQLNSVVPTVVTLDYLLENQVAGAEDKTPTVVPVYKTLTVSMAKNSGVKTDIAIDGSYAGTINLNLSAIEFVAKDVPNSTVKVAEVTAMVNRLLDPNKHQVQHITATIGPLTAPAELLAYAPVAAKIDIRRERTPNTPPQTVEAIKPPETSYAIQALSITTKNASLDATGNFSTSLADILPVGKGSVSLKNAPFILDQLRKYAVIRPENEAGISQIIELITGSKINALNDATIAIERTRGGAFAIGHTTFEELVAVLLKQAIQQGQRTGSMPVPLERKPLSSSKPIHLPDNSVRG
jgi:hypothetical protein